MADQKVAVVTGATSGIGQYIALGLARAGFCTVLVARSTARAEAAQRWIAERAVGAVTELMLADLSSLEATRSIGRAIAARHPRIDVLVNNAGLITAKREVTAEGHEVILAVNHLSPFVLTEALEPALKMAAPARVVNVGSAASDRVRIDLDDLEGQQKWRATTAYGRSKLAIMMATFDRARRLHGSGVAVNVVHPGVVATRFGEIKGPIGLAWRLGAPFMLTPEQGADTPLHVALSPQVEGVTGRYFKRRKEARPNTQALDPALVGRLRAETVRLVA